MINHIYLYQSQKWNVPIFMKRCIPSNVKPLVSIITPSFNSERYIEQTILSVKNQTYDNIEHIVVDGKSTDKTLQIVAKYKDRIRLISEQDSGMYDAINKGLKMAKGEILCYINSDDLLRPRAIELVVKEYLKTKNDVFIGFCDYINEKGQTLCVNKFPFIKKNIGKKLKTMPFLQPATFWSKKWLDVVGLFDIQFKLAGDFDFFVRLINTDKISYFYYSMAAFRIHETQISNQTEKMKREDTKVLIKYNIYGLSNGQIKNLPFRFFYRTIYILINYKLNIVLRLANLPKKSYIRKTISQILGIPIT
jgi:glycosyltransferase involved in cell wall biosynthesis